MQARSLNIDDINAMTEDVPEELRDILEEENERRLQRIEAIGRVVGKRRDEAVAGRKASGIETIWDEDDEYYLGIDEASRGGATMLKSPSIVGGISPGRKGEEGRCTAFFNISRQFVDSASARMGDILLPAGDWNFSIKATPVQDDVDDLQSSEVGQQIFDDNEETRAQAEEEAAVRQRAADSKAELAELQVRDWLTECSYHAEARKVIESSARIGTGVIKGPFPTTRKSKYTQERDDGTLEMKMREVIAPASKHLDPRDCFPDPNCGEDIQDGVYFIERGRMTAKQLKDLKKHDDYISEAIDNILEEGPGKRNYDDGHRVHGALTKDDDRYEVWYYHGMISVADMTDMAADLGAMGCSCGYSECAECNPGTEADYEIDQVGENDALRTVSGVITMVNDTPIKAHLSPLDNGEFPYDIMPWQQVPGMPWGVGVTRQGRTAQDMLNAAGRALMDNAGIASGPQIVMRQKAIMPADGNWKITPRKIWLATEQASVKSVADAFTVFNIPMVQAELNGIIELAYKMMEDATGISYLLQGQQGSAPDTVGGMELLHRNASSTLRRLGRIFDERVTEPHIRRYYDWILQEGPEKAKGDVKIEAIGSTSLVERDIQAVESMVFVQLSLNPAYGIDPEKAMKQALIAKRMIPEKLQLDDEKKAELAQQQQPEDPRIVAAKIKAESDQKIATVREQAGVRKVEVDTDRDNVYQQVMSSRDEMNYKSTMEALYVKRELAILDYANKRELTLDKVKASLAETSMTLRTQKELAGVDTLPAEQVATPMVEPAGRAENGKAFQE